MKTKKTMLTTLLIFSCISGNAIAQSYVYRSQVSGITANIESIVGKEDARIKENQKLEDVEMCSKEGQKTETVDELLVRYTRSSPNHKMYYNPKLSDTSIGMPDLKNGGVYFVTNYDNGGVNFSIRLFKEFRPLTDVQLKEECPLHQEGWMFMNRYGHAGSGRPICGSSIDFGEIVETDGNIVYSKLNTEDIPSSRYIEIYERYDKRSPENPEKYEWCVNNGYPTRN